MAHFWDEPKLKEKGEKEKKWETTPNSETITSTEQKIEKLCQKFWSLGCRREKEGEKYIWEFSLQPRYSHGGFT
jgi:hypothetical protein